MIDKLEHAGGKERQSRSVDGLPVRIITHTKDLRMLWIVDIESEVISRQHPVEAWRDELVQRYLCTGYLSLKLVLCTTLERIGKRLDLRLQLRVAGQYGEHLLVVLRHEFNHMREGTVLAVFI